MSYTTRILAAGSFLALAVLAVLLGRRYEPVSAPPPEPAILGGDSASIYYFYDPHCEDCREVEAHHLEALAEKQGFPVESVVRIDVTKPAGVQALLDAERFYGFTCKSLAPIILIRGEALCGLEAIQTMTS